MVVGKLISVLQSLPADYEVQLEGCDCVGACTGYTLGIYEKEVVLRREDGTFSCGSDKDKYPIVTEPIVRA